MRPQLPPDRRLAARRRPISRPGWPRMAAQRRRRGPGSWRRGHGPRAAPAGGAMAAHLYLVSSGPPQPLPLGTGRGWLSTWGRSRGRATGSNASARGRGQPLWSSGPRAPGCVGFGYSDGCAALNVRIGGGDGRLALPLAGNRTGSYSAAAVATTWPGTATLPGGSGQLAPLAGPSAAGHGVRRLLRRRAAVGEWPRCGGIQAAARAVGPAAGSAAWAHRTAA